MSFDATSYIIGYESGKEAGASDVIITGAVTCTDDGSGNITITEETE